MGDQGDQGDAGLTTGAVARRFGVSPTTLRSWDRRYGLGPATRHDGRHRRWTPGDIAVLEEMCRLTSAGVPPAEAARVALEHRGGRAGEGLPPERGDAGPQASRAPDDLALSDARRERRGLARAAVRLDAPALQDRLTSLVDRYGLVAAWQEVLAPALHAVGRKWEVSGDRHVEVEHLLSWHISTTLRRATAPAAPRSRAPLLLACVPGEQHTLPLEALNAALTEAGLPTRMFGAAVPAEAVVEAVRRTGPAAVVLWSQARSTASLPLALHVGDTRWGAHGARRRPLVLLGGPGWAGPLPPGMLRPSALSGAVGALERAYARPGAPLP